MKRQMVSCFKGLAPVAVPSEWLDTEVQFASVSNEARVRFVGYGAYGVSLDSNGPDVNVRVRKLSDDEETETHWGGFCSPWEPYHVAKIFGHGRVTNLDMVT